MISPTVNHRQLYRLPWSLPDNAISWLEPTSACNLACDGCYRENVAKSHKSLEIIRQEVETFRELRNSDGISIAGGDPLMHPNIVEIVRMIAEMGFKPVINTNGGMLTPELLRELKRAGALGFTFHIDSKQGRPKWKNKNEVELNELRLHYAEMLAEASGLSCAFNSTVYEDTLPYTPELIDWAAKHIDIVHVMVFILFRAAVPQLPFDWYAGGRKINLDVLAYSETKERKIDLKSTDVVAEIRKRFPEFTPCAYLNGTEKPDSFKWLLSGRIGSKEKIYGYVGPKFMETIQTMYHLTQGRYLAYTKPAHTNLGRSMLLLSLLDRGVRGAAGSYLSSVLTNPLRLFKGLHYQSIMIIQPVDFLENGLQNMCDGCPDMTLWNGKLVWSCRMEELKHFGCWVRSVPRASA
ncbi:MAG: radical SAM protein [candidate division KSB1 bacterium]|nr:radical SAM protein [candidate division KSB1 bacterium]